MKPIECASSTSTIAPCALATRDHLLQRRDVAEHRIDALEHHQLARAFGKAPEALFERLDVVVAGSGTISALPSAQPS